MGKNLIQQARGKGGPCYRAPSFRYKGSVKHLDFSGSLLSGKVLNLITCQGHTAPLAEVKFENGKDSLIIAPEGIREGDIISVGADAPIKPGNALPLRSIPDGTLVYNIENQPGDGGRFCRASGAFARVLERIGNNVTVQLPSKAKKALLGDCRACIGIVAGSGRPEKPFAKAGKRWFDKRSTNKRYPMISGSAQNAADHPFGNSRSSRKSKARPVSRHAPAGRKVGMIAARRTGRKK